MSFRSGVQDQVSSLGIKNISVNSIRSNAKNFYAKGPDEEELVDQMAHLLKCGQAANILVYEDLEPDDGKRFTLISGERRYKAMLKLVDAGESDGMISAKIVNKPESDEEEMIQLISGNAQRAKSSEVRKQEIRELKSIWDERKKRKETSGRFVEWAASLVGMSARSVTNYLDDSSEFNEVEADEPGDTNEYDPVDVAKANLQAKLDELSARLTELYPYADKIKINPSMTMTLKLSEIGNLESVISDLGLSEMYYSEFSNEIISLINDFHSAKTSKKRKG